MAKAELIIVIIKFVVLLVLAIGGLTVLKPELLAPSEYPGPGSILSSVAITFFAYEGFRVITNAAEDVPDPAKTIPRAILTSIVLVMGLYLLVSISVFGTLTGSELAAARENALAEAARPVFGSFGFGLVSVTALIATASAINASLYAVTNTTYQMAKEGELPGILGEPIAHSREGLLVSAAIISILAAVFDLRQIAVLGAVSILLVHAVVYIGHLRLINETRARPLPVALAALFSLAAIVLSLLDASPTTIMLFAAGVGTSFAAESVLRRGNRRPLRPRTR